MKKLIFPTCVLAITYFSGCSKVQDMHDATMEMSSTTTELANTTKDTKNLMQEIYDSGRQGASLDLRNKLYQLVTDSKVLEEKSTNAGLYFMAFEYELWSDNGSDSRDGQRYRLMKDATEEFFCHLLAITHWSGIDPFAGKNPLALDKTLENEKASFNAFAMTLEKTNRKQDDAKGEELDSASMRNMIETALRAGKKIEAGQASLKDYPDYVSMVLSHRAIAIDLLKARYQMMGLTTLRRLTTISNGTLEGINYKILGASWKIVISKRNESVNNDIKFYMNEAARAKKVLNDIGEDVKIDASLQSIFSNARIVINQKNAANNDEMKALFDQADELKTMIKDYTAL